MALSSTALITLAEARARNSNLTSTDATLEYYIEEASLVANTHARRHLASKTYTEYYTGDGSVELYVNNYPISSITSIHIDPERSYGSSTAITDYTTDDEGDAIGCIYRYNEWDTSWRAIKIIYIAGYVAGSNVPEDLLQALVEIVTWRQRRDTNGLLGIVSHSYGDESVQLQAEGTPPSWALRTFERYRRGIIG